MKTYMAGTINNGGFSIWTRDGIISTIPKHILLYHYYPFLIQLSIAMYSHSNTIDKVYIIYIYFAIFYIIHISHINILLYTVPYINYVSTKLVGPKSIDNINILYDCAWTSIGLFLFGLSFPSLTTNSMGWGGIETFSLSYLPSHPFLLGLADSAF